MISTLRGKLIHKHKNEIILDVNGVGYQVFISKKASEKISDKPAESGTEYTVTTHLDVKENSLTLYGFVDEKEKEIFKLLTSVNGIGRAWLTTYSRIYLLNKSYVSFQINFQHHRSKFPE
ncbi:MAG: hypothetical protein IPL53_25495 [Ignavibacteria bacterium]|nr:hypothetical protein [Ignavibacteria bacterium]